MSEDAATSRSSSVAATAPWAASIVLHAGLIVVGLFVGWMVVTPPTDAAGAAVSFFDPAPAPPTATLRSAPPPAFAAPDAAIDADAPLSIAPADQPPLPSISDLIRPPEIESLALPPLPRRPADAAAASPPPPVQVFGSGVSGVRRLVYLVDGSASMTATLPMVASEVKASIGRLDPTQEFQVYFFRSGDYAAFEPTGEDPEVPRSTLHRATHANKKAAFAWLDAYRAAGASNPLYALEVALSHPNLDAVFLLSTRLTGAGAGALDPDAMLAALDRLNPADRTGRRRVTVNVVQFFERDPSGLLAAIGEAHGGPGGYVFIPREEVVR